MRKRKHPPSIPSGVMRPITFKTERARMLSLSDGYFLISLQNSAGVGDGIICFIDGAFINVGKVISKTKVARTYYYNTVEGEFNVKNCRKIIATPSQIALKEVISEDKRYHIDMDDNEISAIVDGGGYCDVEMQFEYKESCTDGETVNIMHLYCIKKINNKVIIH